MTTSFLPLKYLISPAAGYTTSEVPPIISVSASDIYLRASDIFSSFRASSYSTTSGFTVPPHFSHLGTPSEFTM